MMESTYGGVYVVELMPVEWSLHKFEFTPNGVYIRWSLRMVDSTNGEFYIRCGRHMVNTRRSLHT